MDKTTKLLLALIAAGLWLNAAAGMIRPANAQDSTALSTIARDISSISSGICTNQKLC